MDAVTDFEPGKRLVAVKNVSVNEDFFQGHFPGSPLMPGVLMIESLAQAAAMLVAHEDEPRLRRRAFLRGVNEAKFRRAVVPGDRVRLELTLRRSRATLAWAHGVAYVDDQVVAEAELLFGIAETRVDIHPSAIVDPSAHVGEGTSIGPHAVVGPHVRLGQRCQIGASSIVEGWTEIGDGTQIFPFASIGLIPQDLKFKGEESRLVMGRSNIVREFVTIHRGTEGGGGVTRIGDRNLIMAYAHVAHDCQVGSDTILGNGATLGGHVVVEDFATISPLSGVHQFCRVGKHAFVGGASVVTKDALPYAKSVGNRARIYGLNTIGLVRRGLASDTIGRLKKAYRYLLQSKLNTTQALQQIDQDPDVRCAEVDYLVTFIRSSTRGVTLRRGGRRPGDTGED